MKPVLALRHVVHEGLGTIEDAFREHQIVFSIVDLFNDTLPQFHPERLAGLVVMGGPMNVDETDKHPFLADEIRWLQQAVDVQLPVLGVCLGSQLLAKALGAKVRPNRIKEIGWYDIELTAAARTDRLLSDSQPVERVFQWHGDTFDLPDGAVHLARSVQCEQQAFRYGPSAYGFQFHIEMTAPIVEDWLTNGCNCGELATLDYIDPAAIRRETPERIGPLQTLAHRVLGRFAALCKERA
jgi:GMP synthase (glutamine-hydrolysing)